MDSKVFIDANVFLEIFLEDSRAADCKNLLTNLEKEGKEAFTTDFILYSCILIAQRNLKETRRAKEIIIFFNSLPNLKILRPTLGDIFEATESMPKNNLDFDDSLVIACMKKYGIKNLASLDKHFDKVNGIKKIL